MAGEILTLNAGSSSIKCAVFDAGNQLNLLLKISIEYIGKNTYFNAESGDKKVLANEHWPSAGKDEYEACFTSLLRWLEGQGHLSFSAIGHRVVHGGSQFTSPIQINDATLKALDAFIALAPLHQPHNLNAIRMLARLLPDVPQIACFDTAFHSTMPIVATRFGLPRSLEQEGIRRYGFHGLSYEYIARTLAQTDPALAKGRVIVAHLGNGASLCAMHNGRSIDTTMGFSALDGLVMGTRCGALDPEVSLHLIRSKQMALQDIEHLFYHESGLLGVSGISSDMRELQASNAAPAKEAIELFIYRIVRNIGALTASLGGLDGIVFTAGIGEHDAGIRRMVCEKLRWLGAEVDANANQQGNRLFSTLASRIALLTISTDEERIIALHTRDILGV